MTLGNVTVIVYGKDKTRMVFTSVTEIETVGNRMEIKSVHNTGAISADLDLDKCYRIFIVDNEDFTQAVLDNENQEA